MITQLLHPSGRAAGGGFDFTHQVSIIMTGFDVAGEVAFFGDTRRIEYGDGVGYTLQRIENDDPAPRPLLVIIDTDTRDPMSTSAGGPLT